MTLPQMDPDRAKQEIQLAAVRLIELAAATPAATSAAIQTGLEADHKHSEAERPQLQEHAERQLSNTARPASRQRTRTLPCNSPL